MTPIASDADKAYFDNLYIVGPTKEPWDDGYAGKRGESLSYDAFVVIAEVGTFSVVVDYKVEDHPDLHWNEHQAIRVFDPISPPPKPSAGFTYVPKGVPTKVRGGYQTVADVDSDQYLEVHILHGSDADVYGGTEQLEFSRASGA